MKYKSKCLQHLNATPKPLVEGLITINAKFEVNTKQKQRIILFETKKGGYVLPNEFSVVIYYHTNTIGFNNLTYAKASAIFWALASNLD